MKNIDEYIDLPKADRQKHLDLTENCVERGGDSLTFRGLLAFVLDTTIPSGRKIHLCHACHNSQCSNPKHLYWGTPKENTMDDVENGRLSIWDRMVEKYGLEEARAIQSRKAVAGIASKAGKGNTGKNKTIEHRRKIAAAIKAKWQERQEAIRLEA